jgi:ABC-type glycerol-3-phosphate transport system substrate-binding protein
MTPARITRGAALLVAGLVVAACGGATASSAPDATQAASLAAPVVTAAATPAPTELAIPSFVLPSFHGNVSLEQLIPAEIGGEAVDTQSMTGQDYVGLSSGKELLAVLSGLHKQPSDLSVALGTNTQVVIIAVQVKGVPGSQLVSALISGTAQYADATITAATIGGKQVQKIEPSDGSDTQYLYTKDDVVFGVGGSGVTDAVLNEAFSKLP